MLKLLHTADCHLDSPLRSLALRDPDLADSLRIATRQAFERIVETCIDEAVAALLISGDLYDGEQRSARTAAFVVAAFERLQAAGIRVFCIRGNHDAENPVSNALSLPANVHVFGGRGGKEPLADGAVWIHGVSFSGRQAPDSLLPKFQPPVPGAVNVAMLHTSLAGAAGHDPYAPCTVAELAAMGFDYWALGHVHRRQVHAEAPWIVMPGMPQGRDIGEAGPKSATLLTVEGGQIALSEVPTAAMIFVPLTVDLEGVETEAALRDRLRTALAGLGPGPGAPAAILRLRLAGATPLCWSVLRDRDAWTETARNLARDAGRFWVETVAFDLSPPSEPVAGAPGLAVAELAALMAAVRAEPGMAEARARDLDAVLAELPVDLRRRLIPDEAAKAALSRDLAQAGATRLLAQMRGGAAVDASEDAP